MRDLGRTGVVRGWHRDQRAYKRKAKGRVTLRQWSDRCEVPVSAVKAARRAIGKRSGLWEGGGR
jgi:hypothetical protein